MVDSGVRCGSRRHESATPAPPPEPWRRTPGRRLPGRPACIHACLTWLSFCAVLQDIEQYWSLQHNVSHCKIRSPPRSQTAKPIAESRNRTRSIMGFRGRNCGCSPPKAVVAEAVVALAAVRCRRRLIQPARQLLRGHNGGVRDWRAETTDGVKRSEEKPGSFSLTVKWQTRDSCRDGTLDICRG